MSWEKYGDYKTHHSRFNNWVNEMKSRSPGSNSPMELNYRRIHPRQTLDQYTYPSLEDTERRDAGQTVSRWSGETGSSDELSEAHATSRLIMVDHLWCWVVDDCELR